MIKYIDTDKLKEKIYAEDTVSLAHGSSPEFDQGCHYAFLTVLSFIDSLQQEQLPGIEEHGVPGRDFIPVEWVDACEKYGKWKIVQQEQQEVDLEKEIDACWRNWLSPSNQKEVEGVLPKTEFAMYARHFYELGLNARKEE